MRRGKRDARSLEAAAAATEVQNTSTDEEQEHGGDEEHGSDEEDVHQALNTAKIDPRVVPQFLAHGFYDNGVDLRRRSRGSRIDLLQLICAGWLARGTLMCEASFMCDPISCSVLLIRCPVKGISRK